MRTKKNFSKAIVIVLALAAIATFTAVFNDGTTSTPVAPESTGSVDYVNDPEAVYNHEDVTTNGKTWDEVLAEREERDKDKNQNNSSNNNNDKPVQKGCGAKGFTYADGTTSQTYIEFLFDNLIANGDTERAIPDTLVKSGVTNKMAGQTVHSNSYGTIDVTHANEGYVTLKLTKNSSKKIKGALDYTDADGKTLRLVYGQGRHLHHPDLLQRRQVHREHPGEHDRHQILRQALREHHGQVQQPLPDLPALYPPGGLRGFAQRYCQGERTHGKLQDQRRENQRHLQLGVRQRQVRREILR